MSYQTKLIKSAIVDCLGRRGVVLTNESDVNQMVAHNIRRLKVGEHVAIEVDDLGRLTRIDKICGLDCLHSINETAIVISFHEIERFFNEQHDVFFKL